MANVAIGWDNLAQSGTVAAGSALAAFPATNIQNDQGAWKWRSAGVVASADGAYLDIDAGAAADWKHFLVAQTNLTPNATVSFSLGTSVGASDVYASGALSGVLAGYLQLCHIAASTHSARYLRIAFEDSSNPDGNIAVGLVWAGVAWSPEVNILYGSAVGRETTVQETVTRGGQEFPTTYYSRRIWNLQFDALTEAEVFDEVYELDRLARLNGNVLFIPDPASDHLQKQATLGRIKTSSPIGFKTFGRFSHSFQVTERL